MTRPTEHRRHDPSHAHIDLGELMDGSGRGPVGGSRRTRVSPGSEAGGNGEETNLTGEDSDAYGSGQDEGSID